MGAEENPLVASILEQHGAPAMSHAVGRPPKTSGLSMTPEAIRMRARRAKEKSARANAGQNVPSPAIPAPPPPPPAAPPAPGPAPTSGDKMTPAHLQLLPDGPSRSTVSPELMEKAVRDWTRNFKLAGTLAAKFFKSEELKLTDVDAADSAEALLDGWPELARETDADWKKLMAVATIAGVANERWDARNAAKVGRPAVPPDPTGSGPELVRDARPVATGERGRLPMEPVMI